MAAGLGLGVGGVYTLPLVGVTLTVPQVVTAMGPTGIWWGFVVSNVVGALLALAWFKRGRWRDAELRGSDSAPTDADDMDAAASDD